jgi:LysM repeat protein
VGAGASGAAGGLHGGDPAHDAVPEEGRGLAGSAADRLASGDDPGHAWIGQPSTRPSSPGADAPIGPSAPPDPELAGLVGRRASERGRGDDLDDAADEPRARSTRRPTVSSTRDRSRDRDRERERNAPSEGPSWERVRRYEAYPSIKARAGLPSAPQLPRIAVLFGALVVAALLLFLLPTVLNIGGGRVVAPGASASPSDVAASASLEPTPIPEPTPQIYTIKAGDALARIARRFGLTLEQLLAANSDIKDPNRIKVGDKIVIPTPPPEEVPAASPSASAAS